jgi:dTDP-4-dehydrorhamnose reductase
MKKTILITGSNGLLGHKIVYKLRQRKDVQVIATSKGENKLSSKDGYIYESLDITNESEVNEMFFKYLPDVVINTAAMTNVDACEDKKEECYKLNTQSVETMVAIMEKIIPSSQLIHLSTDFIFDGTKDMYSESDISNPINNYGISKFEAESIIFKSKLKWAICRTTLIYGIADNMSRSNIVLWAKNALNKGQAINVVDDQFRSPTLAEDLADGCIAILDKEIRGVFNLSGPQSMSMLDLVYIVADFWNLDKSLINPIKSDSLNQVAKRPPRTELIIEKAKKQLNYNPHSFESGLRILDEQLKINV